MKRILFVDDEPRVLEGLQRMLRPQRKQWDVFFANSGEQALALLETAPFDVIVTDMRMPAMDGAMLLKQVQERFPGVVRIVLSGYYGMEAALRAVPVAHRFLSKPCDPERLREAIERSCECSAVMTDEAARRVVAAVGELPSLPSTSASLMAALRDPDVGLNRVGEIVERDVGMTAKVLQLVNSAFFGLPREITTVGMAVSHLGLDILKQLVLSSEIFRTFQPARSIPGFSLKEFEAHSRLAANIASRLPVPARIAPSAVMAALLHDTGKLVLAARLPAQFEAALRTSLKDGRPLYAVEEDLTGTGHAEIGAYLLGLWGLPGPIVNAVRRHHRPTVTQESGQGPDILAITHVADALAFETAEELTADAPAGASLLNADYLAEAGVAVQLPAWRALAQEVFRNQGGVQ
jgi:HD-like signal output (HDOD) protein